MEKSYTELIDSTLSDLIAYMVLVDCGSQVVCYIDTPVF